MDRDTFRLAISVALEAKTYSEARDMAGVYADWLEQHGECELAATMRCGANISPVCELIFDAAVTGDIAAYADGIERAVYWTLANHKFTGYYRHPASVLADAISPDVLAALEADPKARHIGMMGSIPCLTIVTGGEPEWEGREWAYDLDGRAREAAEEAARAAGQHYPIRQIMLAQLIASGFGHQWAGATLPARPSLTLAQVEHATYASTSPGAVGWGNVSPGERDGNLIDGTATGRSGWSVRPDLTVEAEISRPNPNWVRPEESYGVAAGLPVLSIISHPSEMVEVTRVNPHIDICERHVVAAQHLVVTIARARLGADLDTPVKCLLNGRVVSTAVEWIAKLNAIPEPPPTVDPYRYSDPVTLPIWRSHPYDRALWTVSDAIGGVVDVASERVAYDAYRLLADGDCHTAAIAVKRAKGLPADVVADLYDLQERMEAPNA